LLVSRLSAVIPEAKHPSTINIDNKCGKKIQLARKDLRTVGTSWVPVHLHPPALVTAWARILVEKKRPIWLGSCISSTRVSDIFNT